MSAPDELLQIDFKGDFALANGQRCYPLTVLDDHSRFLLGQWACADQTHATVQAHLTNRRWKVMRSLREALGEIQDDRAWCTYSLEGMLTVVVLAMLCGKNSVKGIARWAREYRWEYAERVGFPRDKMPSLGTFQRVFAAVDDEELARVVGQWGEDALPAYGQPGLQGIAIDGKTVRGSQGESLLAVQLISALSQQLQVALGQMEVGERTNEIKGVLPLLANLVLEGRVVTVDALLTQRDIAQTIIEEKGIT
jgi:hypothetical protein